MAKSYTWRIAEKADFPAIYTLLYNSELKSKWSMDDVRNRVGVPLCLGQLMAFHDEAKTLQGFLTYALMNKAAAAHQATIGIQHSDWQSGSNFWVVDFVGEAKGMLRTALRDLGRFIGGNVHYFRLKHQQIRKVHS